MTAEVAQGVSEIGVENRLIRLECDRRPVALDRRITLAVFVDELDYHIRGAYPLLDPYTNRVTGYPADWALYGDYGAGIRFDIPQLGLRTVRIDFARGANGFHTSFGIGQSF